MTKLTLRHTGPGQWTLYSESKVELHTFTRCTPENAILEARAWASSWIGVTIGVEDERGPDREDPARD